MWHQGCVVSSSSSSFTARLFNLSLELVEDKVNDISMSFLKECAKEAGCTTHLEPDIPLWPNFISNLKRQTLKYLQYLELEKATMKPHIMDGIDKAINTASTKVVIPWYDDNEYGEGPSSNRPKFQKGNKRPYLKENVKPKPKSNDRGRLSVAAYFARKNKQHRQYFRYPSFISNCVGTIWFIDVDDGDVSPELIQYMKLGLNFVFRPSTNQLTLTAKSLEDVKPQQDDKNLIHARFLWSKIRDKYMALPTDKNMGCSIISRTKYQELKTNLLEDSSTFQLITLDNPTIIINHWLNKIQSLYTYIQKYLMPQKEWLKLAKFSGIPKVHKNPIKLRPIVNCSNIFTTPLAQFLHEILIDVVKKAQYVSGWMITRTEDFTDRIDETKPEYWHGKKMYTADIKSLYTEIPHKELFIAVHWMLNSFRLHPFKSNKHSVIEVSNATVLDLIKEYLGYNFLSSSDLDNTTVIYRQIKGIPTGGNCSPELANLYLMYYEIRYRERFPEKWELIRDIGRYLDDLICITMEVGFQWSDIQKVVYDDTIELEDNSIKGNREGIFLDIKVRFDQHDTLYYTLYRKPGNAYQYIHYYSYMPRHIKKNFIINELRRIKKRCKRIQDHRIQYKFFYKNLIKRGYPLTYLKLRYREFLRMERRRQNLTKPLKKPKNTETKQEEREFLVVPYNHLIPRKVRNQYFLCLRNQRKFREYLK